MTPAVAAVSEVPPLRAQQVIVTGDLNVAPTELDIHSPKTNLKSAGGWVGGASGAGGWCCGRGRRSCLSIACSQRTLWVCHS